MSSAGGRRIFYGWFVAGTAIPIYFFTNGMSLFVPQNLFPRMMETFGATARDVSITVTITLGLAAFIAPFIGAIVDRFGVVRVIRTGLAVMAVCFSLYPFARSVNDLYWIHAGLALGLALAGLLVNVVLLSNWFVRRRGAVIGGLVAASSLAGALLPLAISPLVNDPQLGWRWGVGALAVVFWLVAVIPGFLILKESPQVVMQQPDGGSPAPVGDDTGERDGVSFGTALRSPTLWCLALGSACLWYSIQAMNSQVTIFFEQEAGFTPQRATQLYSVIFWLSFVGKFLFGALSDRYPKRQVMVVASVTLLIGCLLLYEPGADGLGLTHDPGRLVVFTIVFGLGFGGSFTMIQLVCVESFGQRALGKILGIVTFIDAMGAAAGTMISGQLKTASGGYLLPFAIITAVAVVAVVNVAFIRPVHVPRSSRSDDLA